ncbi:MAG: DUF1318 domain-containing protein [Opitutaceae bacterium]
MKRILLCFSLFVSLFGSVVVTRAEDLGAIKSRMEQRLPALDALRKKGAIGENNRGLTEVRQNVDNAASVSAAENQDRLLVYAEIGKGQGGASVEQVGRLRARQIAKSSTPGVWLQQESGEWYQKQ